MKDKLIVEVNKKKVWYGNELLKVRDLFSRKEERGVNITRADDKFFSNYWQVYAWASIIGFLHNKREKGDLLQNRTSFEYQVISNASESIAYSLVLMAIGKMEVSTSDELLNSREILTIISEYAEGGAKHILELRGTSGQESKFNYADDYFREIFERINGLK
ncbi:hypothetical protein ADIARSV_2795 [Arcticibacter svalbardensis MN12-7]|uniref:Uncharacterized protein n=1 Tax=Arcticibacter svalbardensis MN12-7 TaxID=1150600 RepID=R9GQF8_9SPHI|nr:hypothetical protein [Arcticibacter svalbardensis]EOR93961.1 hypothetical protein ADIARSV_2795 [Arcticibacter svalbardensis MN12-7]